MSRQATPKPKLFSLFLHRYLGRVFDLPDPMIATNSWYAGMCVTSPVLDSSAMGKRRGTDAGLFQRRHDGESFHNDLRVFVSRQPTPPGATLCLMPMDRVYSPLLLVTHHRAIDSTS
jgi:hypothetical protein